jgi:hypothetical protein
MFRLHYNSDFPSKLALPMQSNRVLQIGIQKKYQHIVIRGGKTNC